MSLKIKIIHAQDNLESIVNSELEALGDCVVDVDIRVGHGIHCEPGTAVIKYRDNASDKKVLNEHL